MVQLPEVKPEITFIFDLVRQVTGGKIRIPRFQRPFVWRRRQMTDLFDSIRRQYPVGSLLVWETDAPIATLERIGPIALDTTPDIGAAYVLDGHQRLSTLAGCLAPGAAELAVDEDPAQWRIYFNAAEERFEHLELDQSPETHHFPLSSLLDTVDFLEESGRLLARAGEHGRAYVQRVQDLARGLQNYRVPIIRIRDTGLTEAVEIFARLNSKGESMTADQMVSALLYRQAGSRIDFDLASMIDESMAVLAGAGFVDIDRTVVLRTLLAAVGEDIYRTDWTKVAMQGREELLAKMATAMPRVAAALELAAVFLVTELGVTNDRLLPYSMQMVALAAFFTNEGDPSAAQIDYLKRWFWVSSFTQWFGGENPSRVNQLVRDFGSTLASARTNPAIPGINLDVPAAPLPKSFDLRGARTRALLSVLISLHPRDREGELIIRPDEQILLHGPEAIGYIAATVKAPALTGSPGNRILRDQPMDRGQAKNWLLDLPEGLREVVCASHAVPLDGLDALRQADGAAFVEARLERLRQVESTFMRAAGVVPPASA